MSALIHKIISSQEDTWESVFENIPVMAMENIRNGFHRNRGIESLGLTKPMFLLISVF